MTRILRTETKLAVGFSAINESPQTVGQFFGLNLSVVQYWKQKVLGGTILQQHGGYRWSKFNPHEKMLIQQMMFQYICSNEGMVSRGDIQRHLSEQGFGVSKMYITRVLQSWNWSFKVPTRVNIRKFTLENVEYYFNYYAWAKHQALGKLKFCDESHFNSDSKLKLKNSNIEELRKKQGIGPKGSRVVSSTFRSHHARYSVTLLSSCSNCPVMMLQRFLINCLQKSVSQLNFYQRTHLKFVYSLFY